MPADLDTILSSLRDLASSLETVATLLQERQEQVREDGRRMDRAVTDLAEQVRRVQTTLDTIAEPVSDHYRSMRQQAESDAAASARWGAFFTRYVTPDRVVLFGKYVIGVATVLGIGAGAGANFRGCSGALVTAADSPVTVAGNGGTSTEEAP